MSRTRPMRMQARPRPQWTSTARTIPMTMS